MINKHTACILPGFDIFLNSLAESQEHLVISVVLSGTGSDGSRGSVAVNAAGGFVIAQEPDDAEFDGMPSSVIITGVVDDIEQAESIPGTIAKYMRADFRRSESLKQDKQFIKFCEDALKNGKTVEYSCSW